LAGASGLGSIISPDSNNCINAPVTDHPSTTDSQTPSQANDCDNAVDPLPVGCQNLASQIQGDYNSAALAASQGEPQ
jgi:hypothetical protein